MEGYQSKNRRKLLIPEKVQRKENRQFGDSTLKEHEIIIAFNKTAPDSGFHSQPLALE